MGRLCSFWPGSRVAGAAALSVLAELRAEIRQAIADARALAARLEELLGEDADFNL
jgi:hypothetical protein